MNYTIDFYNVKVDLIGRSGNNKFITQMIAIKMDLSYDVIGAFYQNNQEHPQKVMQRLGINYHEAIPCQLSDSWNFIDCKNIPDNLPDFIKEIL